MKRRYYIIILLLSLVAAKIRAAVGHPFFVNFTTADYGAHNRNFDILSDDHGRVFVANFEGLLCYDQTKWTVIHAPAFSASHASTKTITDEYGWEAIMSSAISPQQTMAS